jgi:Ankyrin repeats (3 copies)
MLEDLLIAAEAALNRHMDIVAILVDAGAVWETDQVDELIPTAMSGDRDATLQLLATDAGPRKRTIERSPDQLVRAAEQNSCDAVALLIELGFDVNGRSRTAPLHEAAMRGNLPVIRLLREQPNTRTPEDPAGAESPKRTEASRDAPHASKRSNACKSGCSPAARYRSARSSRTATASSRASTASPMTTTRTRMRRRCRGRSDSSFAEVSDGLIVRMSGYATEQEARDDLAQPTRSE